MRRTIRFTPSPAAPSGGSGAEPLCGPGPRSGRLRLPVARRRGRDEIVEQVPRDVGDLAHGRSNTASFAFDGFVAPLILRTYWSAAACTSSSVAGGSKLWSCLMFLHMPEGYTSPGLP